MNKTTNYIPGMCNINPTEIKRRRLSGHVGLAASIIIAAIFVYLQTEWLYRIVIFAPIFTATLGYLQAQSKFCVAYAGSGKQHADDGDIISVDDASALKSDEHRARSIYLKALTISVAVTAAFCLVPLD